MKARRGTDVKKQLRDEWSAWMFLISVITAFVVAVTAWVGGG